MLLMQLMYDWDSFLFLASQEYNARNGKSISALARQVSTKNELGKPNTPPIKNERETSTSKRQAEGENRLGKWKFLPMQPLNLTIVIVELNSYEIC